MFILLTFVIASAFFWPGQIHLSWTSTPHQMRVTWITSFYSPASLSLDSSTCRVKNPISITSTQVNFGINIPRKSYVHSAIIQDLDPNCTYKYQVKNGVFASELFSFKGKTHGDDSEATHKMMIFGDLGFSDYSRLCITGILKYLDKNKDILAIVHLGDIAYDLYTNEGKTGDNYGDLVQDFTAKLSYMTVPGNHEVFQNYSAYLTRYIMPFNKENNNTGLFYSFSVGLVRYILLNTNVFFYGTDGEKLTALNWARQELIAADKNRNKQPWIVLLHHQPLYCAYDLNNSHSVFDCVTNTAKLRSYLEDLYFTYKVDLVVTGHMHKYERQSSIYNNTDMSEKQDSLHQHIDALAPVHIISGNGGTTTGKRDPIIKTPISWQRTQSWEYGFGTLTCFNRTHLLWEQYSAETVETVDHVYLIKNFSRTIVK